MPAARVIKIAPRVRRQVIAKRVIAGVNRAVVVEILVKIRLAVVIQIVQASDLIAASDVNLVLRNNKSQRLIKTRREAFPCQIFQLFVDARDDPNIAVERANRRTSIGEEIQASGTNPRMPRIIFRNGERIDSVGGSVVAEGAFRLEGLISRR